MKQFFTLLTLLLSSFVVLAQLPTLPVTFESATVNYTFTDFGGGAATKIANPQVSGINTTANVARMVKGAGEVYGGSFLTLAAPIDFSVNKTFKVKVFSPRVGAKLLLKVENATDGGINFEREATSTIANAWEELVFDYSAISTTAQYSKLVFIFDLGIQGNGTPNFTWLFDEIILTTASTSTTLTQMNLPVTFDDATVNYGLVGFGGADQATIVADPTLATNKVGRVVKTNTAELWAGVSVTALSGTTQTGFATNIPFAAGATRMNVRVYSPHAGIPVRLKVEDKNDPTRSCETEATVTVANGWQTLEFNFANQAAGTAALNFAFAYNKATLFFNFGTTGAVAGERIYFFDDLRFGPAAPAALAQMNLPVTFDDATVNYGLVGFGGAEQATIVADPTLATNKVGRVVKTNTAELWAGVSVTALSGTTQTGFATNIPFAAGATRMNVRVYSPHAGIPVRLKVEDKNDPTRSCETEATVTVANGWQTLEFNFANQATGTAALNFAFAYNKATLFFNFGTTGAVAGERIYFFDDVRFGAAAPASVLPVVPINFESATIDYTFTDFNGGGATKIANPQVNGINTSATVARMVKSAGEVYGGSFLNLASPIDFSVNKVFKVKVYSPRVGARLLLKVENQTNGAVNFEREATSTVANAWEELVFDYSAVSTTQAFNKLVFIFDLGTQGNGTPNFTWLFDDVVLTTATPTGLAQMNVPVTFDDAGVNYGLVGFGGAEQSTIVTDPTNPSNKCARVIKTNTAELWAGTTITALLGNSQTSFANNIPFAAGATRMTVRVWSPHAGIPVRLKVEDKNDPTRSCETEATVTIANGWQTLEFNFANQAPGTAALNFSFNFNKATIFFNFGTTGAAAGERIYYFDDVRFGGIVAPTAPTVVSPANFCTGSIANLTATPTAGNTLLWYTVPTGGTSSATAPTVNTGSTSSITYYVSQINSSGNESPRASIVANVNPTPAAPATTPTFTYCQNATATTLTATTATGNAAKWYTSLTGTGSSIAITPSTAVVGTLNYYVSQTNNFGCESNKSTIAVTTNATPAAPSTSPIAYCQNSTATALTATSGTGNTVRWYTVPTGGTASTTAPTPSTTATGNTTFYASQTNSNGCESPRAALVVTINATAAAPTVTTPVTYCVGATATPLDATAITGNNLRWYTVATGGTASATPPLPNTAVAANTMFYVSQATGTGCESNRAAIAVTVNALPTIPTLTAAPYTQLVPGLVTSITASNAVAGNVYTWYNNGIAVVGQGANSIAVNINTMGNYTVKVTSSTGCNTTSSAIAITGGSSPKIFAYPNPSAGQFQVRYYSDVTNLRPRSLVLYDDKGALVYKANYAMFDAYTPMNVDLQKYAAGIYTIYLLSNEGKVLSAEKILIAR